MKRIHKLLLLTVLLAAAVSVSNSQTKPLPEGDGSFNIAQGSTFSASGGAPIRGSRPGAETLRVSADIQEAVRLISAQYAGKTDPSIMTRDAIGAMLHTLDPHSNFYDRTEWTDLMQEEQSGYSGIGVTISSFAQKGVTSTYVLAVTAGSPADKAGLKFGDRILSVDGVAAAGSDTDFVRERLRGPAGSQVIASVERATGQTLTTRIRREQMTQRSISDAFMLTDGVGYIGLTNGFTSTTVSEFDQALRTLRSSGLRSLVLDLRGNGGGLVDAAVKVAERFLPSGSLIVEQRGRTAVDNRDWRSTNSAPESMPLVILVDRDTASASEILTGAMQDNDRALIVGERTFGKGLVQTVIDLPDETGLTLTTARYFTPSGRSIQRDYTKLDRYDYFNHKEPVSAIDEPYFEAHTTTNRRVVGGNGIEPDLQIEPERLDNNAIRLVDQIFLYCRDHQAAAVEQFRVTHSFADKDAAFVAKRLAYYSTMALRGSAPAERQLLVQDPQISASIKQIAAAGALARKADEMRRTRQGAAPRIFARGADILQR